MSSHEIWTIVHGTVFGGGALLLFALGWAAIWALGKGVMTDDRRLPIVLWVVAALCLVACITGSFQIYPWYGEGPKPVIKSNPDTKFWHSFVMEWKEHIAWISVFLSAAVAFVVTQYRTELASQPVIRRAAHVFYCTAFVAVSIAAFLGVLLNKVAPIP